MPRDRFAHHSEHMKLIRFWTEIVLPSDVSRKSVSRAAKGLTERGLIHVAAAPCFRYDFRKWRMTWPQHTKHP